MTNDVPISVVICAYTVDRWGDIIEAINSVRRQTYQATQVILVVDHNSDLLARSKAALDKDVLVVANRETRGLSGARNTGIAEAVGELIAFIDDDAVAAPDWLHLGAKYCADSDVLGVGAWVIPLWQSPRPPWFPEEFLWTIGCCFRGMSKKRGEVRNLMGGTMIVKRSVFAVAGGFNSKLGRTGGTLVSCEETEMCLRAHAFFPEGRFMIDPDSVVYHKVPASRTKFSYFVRRCRAEGQSKARLALLVRQPSALNVERSYVLRSLSSGILIGMHDSLARGNLHGLRRAGAIAVGLGAAMLGYATERLRNITWVGSDLLQQPMAE